MDTFETLLDNLIFARNAKVVADRNYDEAKKALMGVATSSRINITGVCGNNKIAAIKVIRTFTGLGLADAKKASESDSLLIPKGREDEFCAEFRNAHHMLNAYAA